MRPFAEFDVSANSIAVCTPDMSGRLVGKIRPASEWPDMVAAGVGMPNFHLVTDIENRPQPGFSVAGAAHGFANGRIRPDPGAAFVSPLMPETRHVLADPLHSDGSPVAEAPREILRRQIARLEARGITATFASELEFYAFKQPFSELHETGYTAMQPLYHRHGDNDLLVASLFAPFVEEVQVALAASRIEVDQIQAEGGTGQIEINVAPDRAMASADNHIVFKHIVKCVAHKLGRSVTFLAKPFERDAGSGGHVHLSLHDAHGQNLIGDDSGQLTTFGRHFIAGLAAYTPELTLLHAPYVNSYRRLVPGSYAPLRSSWGYDNRAAMIRLLTGSSGTRFELRLPGADVNPYICYSGLIAAGLAGVQNEIPLPEPLVGHTGPAADVIPADLGEAIAAFAGSDLATEAFTPAVKQHILCHARNELQASRRIVSPWEMERGFENA